MHNVIQFRQNISQLNDTEFDTFFNKIYQSYNKRDLLTVSLFHLLVDKAKKDENNYAHNMNKIINNIIDLRKKSKSKAISPSIESQINEIKPMISFNSFPSTLISLFASYLQLSEVVNFELSNRQNYIAIISISTSITTINHRLNWLFYYKNNYGYSQFQKDNQMKNIKRFQMIKNVGLYGRTISDIQNNENYPKCLHSLWNNLNELSVTNIDIYADDEKNTQSDLVMDTIKSVSFDHLKLSHINMMNEITSFNPLIEFLSHSDNCNINKLSLERLNDATGSIQDGDYHKLKALINLKALRLYQVSSHFNNGIIRTIGDQLESLHIVSDEMNEVLPKQRYSKLKELCIYDIAPESIEYVVDNTNNNLERLHFSTSSDSNWDTMIKMLLNIIKSNIKLEYLAIETIESGQEFVNFMDEFINCLKKKEIQKERFKLRWNLEMDGVIINEYLALNLMEILNVFISNIKDFSLIISSSWIKGRYIEFEKQIDKIKDIDDYTVIIGIEDVIIDQDDDIDDEMSKQTESWFRHITISNKNCCICSFNENWIMQCANCTQFT